MPEFLTVRELADLLRVKERKVYDLAALGDVPCTRATGKLLFPEAEIRAWIDRQRGGPSKVRDRPLVVLGSHDPLLEWSLRQSQCGLATYLDGSADGVARFVQGEGIAAGLHIFDEGSGDWNVPFVEGACKGQAAVLIAWAKRNRGLLTREDPNPQITCIGDLAGKTVVARQQKSGAETLMTYLLAQAGIAKSEITFTSPVHSEQDAAISVKSGDADAALGLETFASLHGLVFTPIVEERFDILVDRKSYFERPFQTLLDYCAAAEFSKKASAAGGYDTSQMGRVLWNG